MNAIIDYPQNSQGLTVKNQHRKPRVPSGRYALVERIDLSKPLKPFFDTEFREGSSIETVERWFEARAGYWSGQMGCILHQVEGEHRRICAYTLDGTFAAELAIIEKVTAESED